MDAKLRAKDWINTRSFLIEERIRQHPDHVALVGPMLCCVRVLTIIVLDSTPRIVAAVFKMQPKPIGVDNLLHGAIGTWVDLESGVLGEGRTRSDLATLAVIPDTNTPFVGFLLPYWDEVKDVALRAAAAFQYAYAIGWDIAISEKGPVLTEGKPASSTPLLQLPTPYGL